MAPTDGAKFHDSQKQATDANQKIHWEIDLSKQQVSAIEGGAAAMGAAALGIVEMRTGKVSALASELLPIAEDLGTDIWAKAIKTFQATPRTNSLVLKSGLDLTFDRNVSLFSKPTDVVSIADQLGNEAHLYATGSRTVVRATRGDLLTPSHFFDQAGVGVHVAVPNYDLPSVVFENKELTPKNLRLYKKVENSFWTGHTAPLERMPNLMDDASKF
jgi:hypothetical protein